MNFLLEIIERKKYEMFVNNLIKFSITEYIFILHFYDLEFMFLHLKISINRSNKNMVSFSTSHGENESFSSKAWCVYRDVLIHDI